MKYTPFYECFKFFWNTFESCIYKGRGQTSHILKAFNTVSDSKELLWASKWNIFISSIFTSDCWHTMIKGITEAVFVIFLFSISSMANIKQESFSKDQWNQFIKNFKNQSDTYFPDYQNITINEPLVTDTINLNVDSVNH